MKQLIKVLKIMINKKVIKMNNKFKKNKKDKNYYKNNFKNFKINYQIEIKKKKWIDYKNKEKK